MSDKSDYKYIGNEGEELASSFLEDKGYRIIGRNYHTRRGEVDIISLSDKYIVFTEVKYRKNSTSGLADEAVSLRKMERICKCAQYYLYTHPEYSDYQVRFDVIAINGDKILHYENAFEFVIPNSY